MKNASILLLLFLEVLTVSAAVPWKYSVSRVGTDKLKNKYRKEKINKYTEVKNLRPATSSFDTSQTARYMTLPLDHFTPNTSGETFRNRYYVQDNYWKPGGPVILHDVGESSAENYIDGLIDDEEFAVSLAKEFNALLILWEHRFYGESAPRTTVSRDVTYAEPEELANFYQYLTIEQALEDVVVFASTFEYNLPNYPDASKNLTADKLPWVFIGASYPGSRAAWIAKRNPGLFKATLASSAPVQLKVDFWEYMTAAEEAMGNGYKNCSADLHAAAVWMSDAWEKKDASLLDTFIEAIYGKDWQDTRTSYTSSYTIPIWDLRLDFLQDAAWTPFSDFQYYGLSSRGTLGYFCDTMETYHDSEALDEGVFAKYDLKTAVEAYAAAVAASSPYTSSSYYSHVNNKKLRRRQSGSLDPYLENYSWLWQICTEFGAFQVSNPSRPENLIPSFINVTSQITDCRTAFGDTNRIQDDGPTAEVEALNKRYEGWNLELQNTLWTNGEFDPWKALSVQSESVDAPTDDEETTTIPKCGSNFASNTQLRYEIKNGLHASDFSEEVAPDLVNGGNDLEPTNTPVPTGDGGDLISQTRTRTRSFTSTSYSAVRSKVPDAANAQSLWRSAMSSWIPCTTSQWTYTPATATPTDASSGSGSGSGSDRNSNSGGSSSSSGGSSGTTKNAGSVTSSFSVPLSMSALAFFLGFAAFL